MITHGIIVSAATGSSINTAFSAVLSNLNLSYVLSGYNLTSGIIGLYVGQSAPTVTIADQKYIPPNGTFGIDSNINQPTVSQGQNLYLRMATTGVVSGYVIVNADK